jgi:hypothetical protein
MNQSEDKNPNLTKPALYRAPQGSGFERLVAYLGAVHAMGPADGRVYVYQDMTEDDSGPYWMVRVTRTKHRKKPEAYWYRLEPDQKCACCDALILDNLSFENAAYHPCADWWRWDYNQEQWICPCCWSKNN